MEISNVLTGIIIGIILYYVVMHLYYVYITHDLRKFLYGRMLNYATYPEQVEWYVKGNKELKANVLLKNNTYVSCMVIIYDPVHQRIEAVYRDDNNLDIHVRKIFMFNNAYRKLYFKKVKKIIEEL